VGPASDSRRPRIPRTPSCVWTCWTCSLLCLCVSLQLALGNVPEPVMLFWESQCACFCPSTSLFLCMSLSLRPYFSASLRLCVSVCLYHHVSALHLSSAERSRRSHHHPFSQLQYAPTTIHPHLCTHHYPPAALHPPLSTRSFAPPADPRRTRGLLHPLGRTLDQRPDARQAPRCEEGVLGRLERSNRLSYCNSGKVAGGQVAQKLTDARVHESTTPRFCLQRVTTVGDGFHGIDVSPRGRRAGFELDTVPVPLDRVLIRRALVHVLVLM
jgi:hypothetical protein